MEELDSTFANFRLSEALMTTYRLVWEEYCSWYLSRSTAVWRAD